LILTNESTPTGSVLPALGLLSHNVRQIPAVPTALLSAPGAEVILVDGRKDLSAAKSLCRVLTATGTAAPILLVTTEGGAVAVTAEWGISDLVLESAGPAEIDTRIKLALGKLALQKTSGTPDEIERGDLVIDEAAYAARMKGQSLDLTFKEFELLKFLAQHPGRVFTRAQLLQEVWGYDYYGGSRTVDVHVRRLRAKLGPEYEALITTVRNVGYNFNTPIDPTGGMTEQGEELNKTSVGRPAIKEALAESR